MSQIDRELIDWELLAEHLDGGLAGTEAGEQVARLVATDPRWAEAAASLTAAMSAVTADLRAVPAPPPMPDDIAARLAAALERPVGGPAPAVPAPRDSRPPARPAGGHAGSGTGHASSGPGRRGRRRRVGWGAGLAVAAGVAAFAAIGLGPLGLADGLTGGLGSDDAGEVSSAAEDGAAYDTHDADDAATRPMMSASGADYRPDSPLFLSNAAPPPAPVQAPEAAGATTTPGGGIAEENDAQRLDPPPPPLDRLWSDPLPCLAAVEAVHAPAPATAYRMDFASFEGEPAVVLWVMAGDGTEWVWVAGPECGTPQAGPDGRYQTRVR